MSTDFENVFCGLNPAPGKLRLAAGGIGWKQNEGGDKPVTVPADQMRHGEWIRCVHFDDSEGLPPDEPCVCLAPCETS